MNVRDAGLAPHDADFIVEAFDSTLAPLAALGSGAMWGSQPFSQKDGFVEENLKDVAASERYQTTGEGDALRIFIAEIEVASQAATRAITPHDAGQDEPGLRYRTTEDGKRYVSVGAAFVRTNWLPGHVKGQFDKEEKIRDELEGKKDGFVYLDVVVTDYRTGRYRKGAGEALIRRAREYGVAEGMQVLYVDAWAGNEKKLNRFYERQGFVVVDGFTFARTGKPAWLGTLMRLDLSTIDEHQA
ncbi:kinesin motor domain-containing protein [Colletotrichum scovillei]|uniref:Acetyltransferase n=1 Tax=Colletotrichum scovillei TaxID=1209932 RepID=A0A9P7QWJ6_9PEZI|nr:kinesin motor domain-containing protein [Colletotrichum scovillei]KAF4784536.1 kinesin motor domain-containing protein [Colletotrichum scovillei]KAG7044513.1 acetyltransferase [Colletotrichum scovillei]KAG7049224.1 acetyltransferase [Colletotrichum scovillei]KAG7063965.1 acetyltransferase [Colletotrichum scovillei]